MSTFEGWPPAAFIWFEGLLADNSKSYFTAHRRTYMHRPGFWVEMSADGIAGAGHHGADRAAVDRYRAAVHEEGTGSELEHIVSTLEQGGPEIHGETLKSAPRGAPRDHPRIRLLRHTHFIAVRWDPAGPLPQSRAALDWVRDTWAMCTPLVGWLREHA